jgi:hypothetical protein
MPNIIGEPFKPWLANQINTRQEAHGSGTDGTTRSMDNITYLNSKTAWIKLASGISVNEDRLTKEGITTNLQNKALAKNRILFAGTSRLEKGTVEDQRKGVYENGYNGAYNLNNNLDPSNQEFGLVPMPGIESVDIQCMNRGSIKKATIKIKAYNREQFNFIDILYLRLGYTVLLEWGNSLYLDNDGNLQKVGATLIEEPDGFFGDWSGKSYNDFFPKIGDMRAKYRGNYDGLLAKVVNFDWVFTSEGTYDITLSLISMGDVVESLKLNLTPETTLSKFITTNYKLYSEENDIGNLEENVNSSPADNILSSYLFLYKIFLAQQGDDRKNKKDVSVNISGNFLNIASSFIELPESISYGGFVDGPLTFPTQADMDAYLAQNYPTATPSSDDYFTVDDVTLSQSNTIKYVSFKGYFSEEITMKVGGPLIYDIDPNVSSNKKDVFYLDYNNSDDDDDEVINDYGFYMRFEHLLSYIRNKILPKVKGTTSSIINIDHSTWSNLMYLFPGQISLDPRVCLVNSSFNTNTLYPELFPWKNEDKGYAWVMNMYINFMQIQSSLDESKDENGNVSLMPFLESICTALNKAMGGINNLEPIIDEESNTIRIIDSSYTDENTKDKEYEVEVFGYNKTKSNFIRNFDLKTAITPEYATMVTIGATAGGYVKGTENTMFSKWNKGIVDRFKEEFEPGSDISKSTPKEPAIDYVENFWNKGSQALGYTFYDIDSYNPFISMGDTPGLSNEIIDKNIAVVTEFYKYCHAEIQKENEKYGSPINGFIPFSLGLTMDGISGIKIYNEINVSTRFLPLNYPESLKFIIKGVNHKLSNQDWETTIETIVQAQNKDYTTDGKCNGLTNTYNERKFSVLGIISQIETTIAAQSSPSSNTGTTTSSPTNTTVGNSGYGEIVGTCGTLYQAPINAVTQNSSVNSDLAELLMDKIVKKLTPKVSNSSTGKCAKYVKNILDYYWKYYSDSTKHINNIPNLSLINGKWGSNPADAKTKSVHDYISNTYGYKNFFLGKNMNLTQSKSITSKIKPNIGDVIAYWDHSGNKEGKQKYGHIQVYVGEGFWQSDFIHSSFVYNSQGCWDIVYMQAPNKPILIKP